MYRELIELYYDTEKPLPADDFEWICKKVLATSQDEIDAVKAILHEFFNLDGDFYRHARCDREILVYRAKLEGAIKAGRASAQSRLNAKATNVERALDERATNHKPITINQSIGRARSKPPEYPEGFEDFWKFFPPRAGGNPKAKAASAYRARRGEGHEADEILAGARRYSAFIKATGKEGTEYVKQAVTFLNEKAFLEPWDLPRDVKESPLYRREGVM